MSQPRLLTSSPIAKYDLVAKTLDTLASRDQDLSEDDAVEILLGFDYHVEWG